MAADAGKHELKTGPPPSPGSSCAAPPFAGLALSLVGLLVMHLRIGGQGVWALLLGVHGVAADMYLIVGGIALAGGGLVFSIIGLVGNAVRRRKDRVIVASIALVVSVVALARGANGYEKYLPTYELFKEAMNEKARQDAAPSSRPAGSQQASG